MEKPLKKNYKTIKQLITNLKTVSFISFTVFSISICCLLNVNSNNFDFNGFFFILNKKMCE